MHPDLKVGLAMAMLIVGFAGAMCFRHRPLDAVAQQESLPADTELDAELELLPVRTYSSATPSDEETAAATDEDGEILSVDSGEPVIPEPIAATENLDSSAAAGNSVTTGEGSSGTDAATSTYLVKSGDTLSGIASRMLGSTQRYDEIFEANRHQLNSPDDLRPGMELIIPPKDPPLEAASIDASSSEATTAAGPVEESPTVAEPTPSTVQRFTPIVPR